MHLLHEHIYMNYYILLYFTILYYLITIFLFQFNKNSTPCQFFHFSNKHKLVFVRIPTSHENLKYFQFFKFNINKGTDLHSHSYGGQMG